MTPAKKQSGQRRRVTKPRRKATAEEKQEFKEGLAEDEIPEGTYSLSTPSTMEDGERARFASLVRRKAELLNEARSPGVTAERVAEIRKEIDGPLADVPILSYQERQRLS